MLYLFHGSDKAGSLAKARKLVDGLRAKKADAHFVHIQADSWRAGILDEHLAGQGLFSHKYIVFLDRVLENAEAKDVLPDFIPAMGESENIFIVLEGELAAAIKKVLEKTADKSVVTDAPKVTPKKSAFNIFALGDAVGARDALRSWTLYREAIDNDHEGEAIAGTLFWQIKSMLLAKKASNAGEAGLNPFVFTKSKKYAAAYTEQELKSVLRELIVRYHDAHRGIGDLELGLEGFTLQLKAA